jgi:hypothetical protein
MATIVSIVGGIVFILGTLSVAWSFIQTKGKPLVQTLDKLTPVDLQKLLSMDQVDGGTRLEALQNADALMKYFESKSSTEGQASIQAVVAAIFATKG